MLQCNMTRATRRRGGAGRQSADRGLLRAAAPGGKALEARAHGLHAQAGGDAQRHAPHQHRLEAGLTPDTVVSATNGITHRGAVPIGNLPLAGLHGWLATTLGWENGYGEGPEEDQPRGQEAQGRQEETRRAARHRGERVQQAEGRRANGREAEIGAGPQYKSELKKKLGIRIDVAAREQLPDILLAGHLAMRIMEPEG